MVQTQAGVCFTNPPSFLATQITETKSSATIDQTEGVRITTDHQDKYFVSFEPPAFKPQVTETRTSPGCPGFGTKTRTSEAALGGFHYSRTVPLSLPDPGVPNLEGTWRDPAPQTPGETHTVTVKLLGCGEEAGSDWVKRFPADNTLSALKEPFQQHVRDFIAALRKAGATVRVISVYRPPPRVYLMHYAFRVGYGNAMYPQLKPESVPKYAGPEKVPICWMARELIGLHFGTWEYSEKNSIDLARLMVADYGINQAHGPAYPSNHSQRNALDMAVRWKGELVVPYGPEAGPTAKQAVVIDSFPRTEKNTNLWHVGRSYGVFKYTSAADPQHWSANGH